MSSMAALFMRVFNSIKYSESRYQVFRDFTAMAAMSIENAFLKSVKIEDQFKTARERYSKEDYAKMCQLLGIVVQALEEGTCDFLGQVFMALEVSSSDMGQFFTPDSLSRAAAELTLGSAPELLKKQRYIAIEEPAAGAGAMALHALAVLRARNVDTDHRVFFQCRELHEIASNMCYVQMSLAGAAAVVLTCNTLTGVEYARRYTPVYYLCNWRHRLSLPQEVEPSKRGKVIRRTRRG